MTTEIEKTKRALYDCLGRIRRAGKHRVLTAEFEERLEEHFEELRKARVTFTEKSDREIQRRHGEALGLESRIKDLERSLGSMTEERDQIQTRLHAVDRAYFEQSQRNGDQAKQIEKLEELNRIAGEELIRTQGIARQYLDDCVSAEKHSDDFSEKLRDAQAVIGHQEQLIVGQRLAIAELYMAKKQINIMAGGGRGIGSVQSGSAIVSNGAGYPSSGAATPDIGACAYKPSGSCAR